MEKIKFSLLVLLGASSYGVLSSILKVGFLNGFSFHELLGGQYVFGWFGLLLFVLLFSRHKISRNNVFSLLVVGTTMSITSIFYGYSIKEIPASIAVILLFQSTWIGVLIEAVVSKTFPSREKLLSILVLFLGTLFASGILEGLGQHITLKGVIYGLLAAIVFALYIFASGRVATTVPTYSKSFLMTTGATILVCLIYPPSFLIDGTLQAGLWKYTVFLGIFGVVVPVICFSIGVPKVGTGLGTILGAAELPVAIMASITLVHERVSLLQLFGVFCILIGVFIPQVLIMQKEKKQSIKQGTVSVYKEKSNLPLN
ncbi:multidrug transporter [Bacillus cereus]|uniref:EamA family transporter n=1 Tax=Bacillus cereus TaxID=1396 RepID=UPI0008FE33E2|nr:EamA family transporter [Bacillus cereus]MDN4100353.1 EamA family transporter [Bacillus cereus]OJE15873.1 multidrug transporter [Bacillus cereus]